MANTQMSDRQYINEIISEATGLIIFARAHLCWQSSPR